MSEFKLSKDTTIREFGNHYFYAKDLKAFAHELGISNSSRLRKDQLEKLIRHYLQTGEIEKAPSSPASNFANEKLPKDSSLGLAMSRLIRRYTNDKTTKAFLFAQARKLNPDFKQKSGAMYWINRWREDQLAQGHEITYGDLVREFVRLNEGKKRLPRIPSTKFNNFISDYLANEPNATRASAMKAWEYLKDIDAPKTYEGWKRAAR